MEVLKNVMLCSNIYLVCKLYTKAQLS